MYTVTFNNAVGELDSKTAKTPKEAAQAAIAMIEAAGALYVDDNITVQGEEGDE